MLIFFIGFSLACLSPWSVFQRFKIAVEDGEDDNISLNFLNVEDGPLKPVRCRAGIWFQMGGKGGGE